MKLSAWLHARNISPAAFAAAHRLARSRVYAWVRDGAHPDPDNIRAVQLATGDEVRFSDWPDGEWIGADDSPEVAS